MPAPCPAFLLCFEPEALRLFRPHFLSLSLSTAANHDDTLSEPEHHAPLVAGESCEQGTQKTNRRRGDEQRPRRAAPPETNTSTRRTRSDKKPPSIQPTPPVHPLNTKRRNQDEKHTVKTTLGINPPSPGPFLKGRFFRNEYDSRTERHVFGQVSMRSFQRRPSEEWHSSCCGVHGLEQKSAQKGGGGGYLV